MSHPDEGTIQMLLDGELDATERRRVESHVAGCASCAARVAEARAFLEEADRLVGVLEVPQPEPRRTRGPNRRPLIRALAWAASIVVAVGIGYWGRGGAGSDPASVILQEGDRPATVAVSPPQVDSAPPAAPAPVLPPARPAAKSNAGPEADLRAGRDEVKPAAARQEDAGALNSAATPPPAAAERAAELAAPSAAAGAGRFAADAAPAAWRVISMEEAVRLLDGQIRLIDGLTPERVETGPGTAVAGADPASPLVRVVYASGTVILDEQRPAGAVAAPGRREDAAKVVGGAVAQSPATGWEERDGIRFVVTGNVSADSLGALRARVR